jgi:hypothetical protein
MWELLEIAMGHEVGVGRVIIYQFFCSFFLTGNASFHLNSAHELSFAAHPRHRRRGHFASASACDA